MTRTKSTYLAVLAVLLAPMAANADLIFAGDWLVDDGPAWQGQPATLTAQETAALLFGGAASDYMISTLGIDPLLANAMAWVDTWGVGPQQVAHDFVMDNGDGLYNTVGDTSAYVGADRCSAPAQFGVVCRNFAFVGDPVGVPEPGTLALFGIGLLGMGLARRRKTA